MASKIFSRNDNQHPEVVIGVTFFLFWASVILTIVSIVLISGGEQETATGIISTLAVLGWGGLALCGYKWGRVQG